MKYENKIEANLIRKTSDTTNNVQNLDRDLGSSSDQRFFKLEPQSLASIGSKLEGLSSYFHVNFGAFDFN
jgi:hypothetical protein